MLQLSCRCVNLIHSIEQILADWWSPMNDESVLCLVKISFLMIRRGKTLCYCACQSTVSRLMIIGMRWNIVVIWWTKRPYIIVSIHGIIIQLFFSCNSPGVGCGGGGSVKYGLALFNNHSNHNLVVFHTVFPGQYIYVKLFCFVWCGAYFAIKFSSQFAAVIFMVCGYLPVYVEAIITVYWVLKFIEQRLWTFS